MQDIESLTHAHSHTYCAPGMADRVRGLTGFDGRILDPACERLLSDLDHLLQQSECQVCVYDLGRLSGRIRALLRGVWKSPAVIVDGQKYTGLDSATRVLRQLTQTGRSPNH
jgi:hypothetical protein